MHLCACMFTDWGVGATALAPDRVNVCGELVKAGNVSPCYTETLDWSIIILGTHPFLCSLSASLLRLLRFLAPPSLHGTLCLRVIVTVMTYLARSSVPSNTNTRMGKRTLRCGRTQPRKQIHTNTPHPLLRGPPVALD